MAQDHIHQPVPRRAFSLTSASESSSRPPSPPAPEPASTLAPETPGDAPSRTRSILNLTSSTLLGIYSSTGYAPDRDDATPWGGSGAETPALDTAKLKEGLLGLDGSPWADKSRLRRGSVLDQSAVRTRKHEAAAAARKPKHNPVAVAVRTLALAAVGWGYGVMISHLHDRQSIAPKVSGIPHHSRPYLVFWAVVAVALGSALPWIDGQWEDRGGEEEGKDGKRKRDRRRGQGWNDVVRSIGAMIGIAFAIRKLPWTSTLQLSLTLALSNPAIWYLLDRTSTGFLLSTVTSISGTVLCLVVNPGLIPAPGRSARLAVNATRDLGIDQNGKIAGLLSHESVGIATWIASVLFVSSICFGNIGRRL